MEKKIFKKSELPKDTIELIKLDCVTYRGCGMGKYCGNWKIKVSGKEYMIDDKLFNELYKIRKMRFAAPYRRG